MSDKVHAIMQLTTEMLNSLADRLVGDWERLAVFLNVDREFLRSLRSKVNVFSPILELLNRWWARSGKWQELHDAFIQCHRNDLAAETSDHFLRHGGTSEIFFQSIAEKCTRHWKELALYLNFSFREVQEIVSSNTSGEWRGNSLKVLTEWKEGRTGQDLIHALEEMNRTDLIVMIEQYKQ